MKIIFCLVRNPWAKQKPLAKTAISADELFWVEPLRALGHEVFTFDLDDYLAGESCPNKQDDGALLRFVQKIRPDWVFMNDYSNDTISPETWNAISKLCKTTDWLGDDEQRFFEYSSIKAKLFTHPVTCDFVSYERYKKLGMQNIILSSWGSVDYRTTAEEATDASTYDATFVGAYSAQRDFLRRFLISSGLKVRFYGNGWGTGKVSLGQMKNIFRTSKINLSLQKLAANYDVRFLMRYPKKIALLLRNHLYRPTQNFPQQILARYFEINACGGFQLAEYAPMLEEYYHIGKEIATFSTPDNLLRLTNYYLDHPEKRKAIARQGHDRAIREHLMIHRLRALIDRVNSDG